MFCKPCDTEVTTNLLDHFRLVHPELDQAKPVGELGLKVVTQVMYDDDTCCERCGTRLLAGHLYGEQFEMMIGDSPVVSILCAECFNK